MKSDLTGTGNMPLMQRILDGKAMMRSSTCKHLHAGWSVVVPVYLTASTRMDSNPLYGITSSNSDNEKSKPNEAGAPRPFLCEFTKILESNPPYI